jgi:hypothetical protein
MELIDCDDGRSITGWLCTAPKKLRTASRWVSKPNARSVPNFARSTGTGTEIQAVDVLWDRMGTA